MYAENINAWSATWSSWIVSTVWQSTVLALVVYVAAALLRRSSPAVRYWLWQIVAIKLLLVPLWTFAVPAEWLPQSWRTALTQGSPAIVTARAEIEAIPTAPQSNEPTISGENEPALSIAEPHTVASVSTATKGALTWTAWLMIGWIAVVAAQVVLLIVQRVRLSRLLSTCAPAPDGVRAVVADCAASLKLARVPDTLISELDCSPFVCGVWRPVVVLPRALESLLADGEILPVLMHELAHIQRRDLLWNWIPQLAQMLYFFHPIAHWASFRIRLEGELACDGLAMSTTNKGAREYAELLVRVVSQLSEPALLRSGSVASAGLSSHLPIRTDQKDRT